MDIDKNPDTRSTKWSCVLHDLEHHRTQTPPISSTPLVQLTQPKCNRHEFITCFPQGKLDVEYYIIKVFENTVTDGKIRVTFLYPSWKQQGKILTSVNAV